MSDRATIPLNRITDLRLYDGPLMRAGDPPKAEGATELLTEIRDILARMEKQRERS